MDARPSKHLDPAEFRWFDFDPAGLVALAEQNSEPEIAVRLASCVRAAWRCETYLAFSDRMDAITETASLENSDEEVLVDLDQAGIPLGVEYSTRECHMP